MKAKDGNRKMKAALTIGPVLFHWPVEKKRDFYFRIADEAPVSTVYIGEVVCSKRAPFFEQYYDEVAARLIKGGKTVVFSSLAEVMTARERKMTEGLCELEDFDVEANDAAALYHLRGKPHRVGQYFNVYNEETMTFMASKGATHITLACELPAQALALLGKAAVEAGVSLEVQVYGRTGLALSARCYHARAHGRMKDNCQLVCEEDPDGMELRTLDGAPFLAVNGIQTLSSRCLNLVREMRAMQAMGINNFRLSPHSHDMVEIAEIFRRVLDGEYSAEDALAQLEKTDFGDEFSNGFYHKKPGYDWVAA